MVISILLEKEKEMEELRAKRKRGAVLYPVVN
jgi:hypothetical protein